MLVIMFSCEKLRDLDRFTSIPQVTLPYFVLLLVSVLFLFKAQVLRYSQACTILFSA